MTSEHRFDRIARAFTRPGSRREAIFTGLRVVGGAGIVTALLRSTAGGPSSASSSPAASCIPENAPCAMSATCCTGSFCKPTSLFNPNVGICTRGTPPQSNAPAPTPTKVPKPTKVPRVKTTPVPDPLDGVSFQLVCRGDDDKDADNEADSPPIPYNDGTIDELIIQNDSSTSITISEITAIGTNEGVFQPFSKFQPKPPVNIPAGGSETVVIGNGETTDQRLFWKIGPNDPFRTTRGGAGVRIKTSRGTARAFCNGKDPKQGKAQKRRRQKQRQRRRRKQGNN